MKINEINIQNFGKLKDRKIHLEPGINLIYGPNESGKSTIHSFLRGMFFGVERYRGRGAKNDPYTRFEPWDRPVDYGGEMEFTAGGKTFHLCRNFYKKDVRQSLICLDDGEELSVPHGDLQMILGGISESIYDNTVSVGQLRSETDEGLVRELEKHMTNYAESGTGNVDLSRAESVLKKKKNQWKVRKEEQEEKWHRRQEAADHQMEYVEKEIHGLESQWQHIDAVKKELEAKQTKSGLPAFPGEQEVMGERYRQLKQEFQKKQAEERENARKKETGWKLLLILAGIFLLAGIFAGKFLTNNIGIWMSVAGVICLIGGFLLQAHGRERHQSFEEYVQEAGGYGRDREAVMQQSKQEPEDERISRVNGQKDVLEQQLSEKATLLENLKENRRELEEIPQEVLLCRREIESLELALEVMENLSDHIRMGIGSELEKRMGEILSAITQGKYGKISMDENMRISLYQQKRVVPLMQVSRGTVEQVYFALRMAVMDVLCQEEMPVMLDDVFAMYDEERLLQTVKWLEQWGGQVLIFTCHRREAQLAEQAGIKVNIIDMEEQAC